MNRTNETLVNRTNETLGRCLSYALGYLDALAGNAFGDDARASAREAAQAIREANVHIAARRATPPSEWLNLADDPANKRPANKEA